MDSLNPGEIYYADYGGDPDHRVIVVSREDLNRGSYVIVVPLTSIKVVTRLNLPGYVCLFCNG